MRGALVIASWLAALPSYGYEVLKDADGDAVAWRGKAVFVVDPSLATRLGEAKTLDAVKAAVETLDLATASLDVTVVAGSAEDMGYAPQAGAYNQNDVLALEQWPFAAHNLAATVVTLNRRTNQIVDADIAFNVSEWRFRVLSATSQPGSGPHDVNDLQNTLTHELGHALGLKHNGADTKVVMFPSAPAGEISKRLLADDDKAGLLLLYPAQALVPEEPEPPVGCSATGGGFDGALLAALGFLFSRRRVLAAGLAFALPLAARAEPPAPAVPERAALGEVTQARSAWAQGTRLIVTEVEVAVRACTQPPCEGRVVLRVMGGRVGDYEQIVAHEPVPTKGETVVVTWKQGRPSLVRWRQP